ncbi:hypothetical protein BDQ12DRAFT_675495 [Crucibulum laeve]|uniref:Ubiquitin carboxyl-terminal hydrolase n=1 Tax=Crucibulum laeve TaxID=68775 RepID=A0A5C3ME83_9AGAR|nr:hypothetical protein BDQ12DRAFT_675495 [Crucibulum laeve]
MMLVSPYLPAPTFSTQHLSEDAGQYRPSRDLETFNSLLPPPIEFIEGSSSGTLAVAEGKYEPINAPPPKDTKVDRSGLEKVSTSTPVKASSTHVNSLNAKGASLYTGGIDVTWPHTFNRAAGLYNSGNTCFLNSALQCLLHTPPLLRILLSHSKEGCRADKTFCMTCSLRQVAVQAHTTKTAFSPSPVSNRLQTIAKHMRKGRQEDSHEFLRYAVDALQKSCLAGYPPKLDPKLAETTWVHKIFGGRLRSRVTCRDCGYNSDTFDRILDLSLDIMKSDTLKDALRKFVAIDTLKGADKYKCEKCKKPVVAEKRFTIQEAPVVLTVHLKRFSPLGRKIGHHVDYEGHLSLQPYMSDGQYGPSYSLYGVICHAGSGPNSGHYYAFIKSKEGRWWEMNDESVTPASGAPTSKKNAYMLFYIRNKGEGLESAVKSASLQTPFGQQKDSLISGMKKRRERDNDGDEAEDKGERVSQPFIGPLLPSPTINESTPDMKRPRLDLIDPQAVRIKSKIDAAAAQKAKGVLASLTSYDSDSEDDAGKESKGKQKENGIVEADQPESKAISSASSLPPPHSLEPRPIPPVSFYGTSEKKTKRASLDGKEAKIARTKLLTSTTGYSNRPRGPKLLRDALDPSSHFKPSKALYPHPRSPRKHSHRPRGI